MGKGAVQRLQGKDGRMYGGTKEEMEQEMRRGIRRQSRGEYMN